MHKYFRKDPPVPNGFYLSQEIMDDVNIRVAVARNCHFPSLINALANDEHDSVRKVARNSEFWLVLGRFQDILDFGKKERSFFARNENNFNLIALLIFERDLEVFNEILQNPFLSTKILSLFVKLLKQRSKDRVDEQMLEMARTMLTLRKEENLKIKDIRKLDGNIKRYSNIEKLLNYLGDEDEIIRKVTKKLLFETDPISFRKFVFATLGKAYFESLLRYFVILSELIDICKHREDLNQISVRTINPINLKMRSNRHRFMGDFFSTYLLKSE